jgi:hypothetical protein
LSTIVLILAVLVWVNCGLDCLRLLPVLFAAAAAASGFIYHAETACMFLALELLLAFLHPLISEILQNQSRVFLALAAAEPRPSPFQKLFTLNVLRHAVLL